MRCYFSYIVPFYYVLGPVGGDTGGPSLLLPGYPTLRLRAFPLLSKGAVFRYRHPGEFLTVVVAAPLQQSGASALSPDEGYCQALPAQYARRRDHLLTLLESDGFRCFRPDGAHYAVDGVFAFGAWGDLALRVSPD